MTHFKLLPGEEVRTPLVALLFWKGDRSRSQNLWRRWMLAHNSPRPGGKLPPPILASCSGGFFPGLRCNEADELRFIDAYTRERIPLDYWWMDAGWYPCGDAWPRVGTWEPDPARFPRGIRAVADHAHAKGLKLILWFEPERVTPGTWLYEKHPEWLLGNDGGTRLLNLGDPEARQWLIDHVDRLLTQQGVDLYRQDFNIDPLGYWRKNDAPDRQGITEIRHVTGYLAYWDELRRRHPSMLIDSCASGGRRNDLETLRRAVPLLRSDYILEPVGQQNHTCGIAPWIPYYGTGVNAFDAYTFRSQMCPHSTFCYDMRNEQQDFAALRTLVGQWRRVGDYYFGDYYPLIPYNAGRDVWAAWQFDRPDLGGGMVQAFRRPESIYEAVRLRLRGLDPQATYTVADLDEPKKSAQFTGGELMQRGLPVAIADQPGAKLLVYSKNARGATR